MPGVEHDMVINPRKVIIGIGIGVDAVILIEETNVLADESIFACCRVDVHQRLPVPSDDWIEERRDFGDIPTLAAELIERCCSEDGIRWT